VDVEYWYSGLWAYLLLHRHVLYIIAVMSTSPTPLPLAAEKLATTLPSMSAALHCNSRSFIVFIPPMQSGPSYGAPQRIFVGRSDGELQCHGEAANTVLTASRHCFSADGSVGNSRYDVVVSNETDSHSCRSDVVLVA